MDFKETVRVLQDYIDEEAGKTIGEGWELDPLVFWNEVVDAQETTGMDIIDAYDEVVSHSSYLLSSHHVIKKHKEKDTP